MQQARQLGRYQLLDRVAFGGMAEIYRAKTQDAEGRTHMVAVKRVLGHLCEDDEFIQMLVDEAKITAALQHENIARIYEFCRTDREYFIAMEYIDGKDVRALLEKARQNGELLPEEHVAWIGMEVARALHSAHTQRDRDGRPLRIVHRDVSPSNVLLSYGGEVKLCDFGIAKATLTRVQTKTGVIKGKVKYMSPEQAMGRKLDHRSDLFSLGTLLYEMLTLQAPFQAPTEIELIFAVRDARKRPVEELRQGVSPRMVAIVDRAMARSRSQRFQSGEEFCHALGELLAEIQPGYKRSHFGRYMRVIFAKEIERELRMLEEYIIEGGSADEVGVNLIADALGPDAPYTQFTAAFVEGADSSQDLKELPTAIKGRPGPEDLLDEALATSQHRGRPAAGPTGLPGVRDLRGRIDVGWGPEEPLPPAPRGPEARPRSDEASLAFSQEPSHAAMDALDDIHSEQTRILTRARIARDIPAGLHDARTRILEKQNVQRLRDALDGSAPTEGDGAADLVPLDRDLHEAPTAFLDKNRPRVLSRRPEARPAPELAQAGTSINDEPTGLKESFRSASVEISERDLSFISGPIEQKDPSVLLLDDKDLEQVD